MKDSLGNQSWVLRMRYGRSDDRAFGSLHLALVADSGRSATSRFSPHPSHHSPSKKDNEIREISCNCTIRSLSRLLWLLLVAYNCLAFFLRDVADVSCSAG